MKAQLAIGVGAFVANGEREVGQGSGVVGEEGFVAAALDAAFHEGHGCVGENVVAVAFVGLGDVVVFKDGIEVAVAGRSGGLADSAAFVDERFLKALVARAHGVVVAEVPFAEDAGAVAGVAKDFRDGDFVGVHGEGSAGDFGDAGAVVVAAGHEAGAGGRAEGFDDELANLDAGLRQGVEVGRAEDGVAVRAYVAVALVVGDHEQDVGLFGLGEAYAE